MGPLALDLYSFVEELDFAGVAKAIIIASRTVWFLASTSDLQKRFACASSSSCRE